MFNDNYNRCNGHSLIGRQAFAMSSSLTLQKKSLSHARTLQHVHGSFMTSALGKKEAQFIATSTVITAVTVWVLFETQTCESSQAIHHIQGRIDQTSTLLMSFRFSFHRVSAHSCNSKNSASPEKTQVSESRVRGLFSIDKTRQFLNPLLINTLWLTRAQSRMTRVFQECCWGFCPNSNFIFISKSW